MFELDDTIAAISTADACGPRAIVRLSGPQALPLADAVFQPLAEGCSLGEMGGFRVAEGLVRLTDASLAVELPSRAYVFRQPRSYTRQDVVELHVPGSPAVASWVLAALLGQGARQARAGEFTARAFFSGRIDLSAAEAVADVIEAANASELRAACAVMDGQVHRLCSDACAELVDAMATVEASIDLAEEGLDLASPAELAGQLVHLAGRLDDLAGRSSRLAPSAQQVRVVLTGRPNTGKSSLLNALSGTDRAVVSALAGTTRDVLTAQATIAGRAVTLCDVAGLCQAADPLSMAAQKSARAALRYADAIVFVTDLTEGFTSADAALLAEIRAASSAPMVLVANKGDLLSPPQLCAAAETLAESVGSSPIITSAVSAFGLDALGQFLAEVLSLDAWMGGEGVGLHVAQRRSLQEAASSSRRAAEVIASALDLSAVAELAAVELREAVTQLGRISGQVASEDVLASIFRRFCVGK